MRFGVACLNVLLVYQMVGGGGVCGMYVMKCLPGCYMLDMADWWLALIGEADTRAMYKRLHAMQHIGLS